MKARRSRTTATVMMTASLVCVGLVAGCQSPVPFYSDKDPDPHRPVLGLGAAVPYVGAEPPPGAGTLAAPAAETEDTKATGSRAAARTTDVYAATRPGMLSPVMRRFPARVYVPNTTAGTVDVVDPKTYRVLGRIPIGGAPQHIVPSWDMKTLWVTDTANGGVTPIDPQTGQRGRPVRAAAPYDLYFTMDGREALSMVRRHGRIDFRDPKTMALRHSLPVPCRGLGHADLTADGSSLVASCEVSGQLVRVDLRRRRVMGVLGVDGAPQDVRLSPDGSVFYVADMARGGVWLIDAAQFHKIGFIPTGRGAAGLLPSRDSTMLYVANRGEGTISRISFASRQVAGSWRLPGGGSFDLGGLSANGRVLWLSGRAENTAYAISTKTGRLLRRVKVGSGTQPPCVYPQPGRYSLGHTGNFR